MEDIEFKPIQPLTAELERANRLYALLDEERSQWAKAIMRAVTDEMADRDAGPGYTLIK